MFVGARQNRTALQSVHVCFNPTALIKLLRWLFIAACSVALTTIIFLTGHFQLLPGLFDQNGIGLTFAIDGRRIVDSRARWRRTGKRMACRRGST
jgi:hypothetical protein